MGASPRRNVKARQRAPLAATRQGKIFTAKDAKNAKTGRADRGYAEARHPWRSWRFKIGSPLRGR
jgi:hypothetical protein